MFLMFSKLFLLMVLRKHDNKQCTTVADIMPGTACQQQQLKCYILIMRHCGRCGLYRGKRSQQQQMCTYAAGTMLTNHAQGHMERPFDSGLRCLLYQTLSVNIGCMHVPYA